jgi:hypothetical protein
MGFFPSRDDEEEDEQKDTVKLTSFFQKKGHDPKCERHSYFKDRCLGSVESF